MTQAQFKGKLPLPRDAWIDNPGLATTLPSLEAIRLLTIGGAILTILWSLVGLVGQSLQPMEILPHALATNAVTAAGFLLGGMSLLLYTYAVPITKRETAARIGGGIVLFWGLGCWAAKWGVFSIAGGLGNNILLQGANSSVPIPIACAILICLGLAILTLPIRLASGHRPSQYFAAVILLTGAVVGTGYLYDISLRFDSPRYGLIDASSAILCVVLGTALFCIHPSDGLMGQLTSPNIGGALLRRLVPMAIGLPIFIGWLGILGQRQSWYRIDFGVALVVGFVTLILLACLWSMSAWATQINHAHYNLIRAWGEQEAKLQLAASAARIGYWRWLESKDIIEIDGVTSELLSLPDNSPMMFESFGRLIAQEDREEFIRTIEKARQQGQSFEIECRPAAARQQHWISVRGFPPDDSGTSSSGLHGVIVDITERRRAQLALEESQQRLNMIVQSAMDAIITVDQDQHILLFNKAAEKLFRCSPAQALGKPINQFIPERFRLRHHSHLMTFQRSVVKAKAMGRPGTVKALRADGQEFPIEASISQVNAGGATLCTVILRDITERLESEETIRESEARFRNMADSAPVMIFITDSTGNCTYLNRQWYGFTGHGKETGLEGWLNYVHEEDRQQLTELLRDDGHWELSRLECRVRRHDGEVRWTLCSLLAMTDERGMREGCIGSIIDITDRKQAEQTLKRSAEELERQVGERTAALRYSQERLRALTHQLTRTEHQERRRIAGELHDYLAQLLVAAHLKLAQDTRPVKTKQDKAFTKDLERILDEALTYTRSLVAKLSPPVLYHLGLPAAVQWLAEQMMEEHQLNVETTLELPPSFPKLPDDIAAILFQSVRELVFNVLKHAGTSQAHITIRTTPDQQLLIEVTDQGRGFDPSHLDQALTIPTSFGLFSIRERMDALGGSMHISSRIKQGTSVTLLYPLLTQLTSNSLTPAPEEHHLHSTSPASDPLHPIRILLVDDHAMVRQGIRALLERHPNVEIVGEAWDGQHACELVETLQPDVIVMDANMPRLDGIEATRRIKQGHPHIVIIGLSVQTATQVSNRMLEAGASRYLTKESAGEQLYEVIQAAIASPILLSTNGRTQDHNSDG